MVENRYTNGKGARLEHNLPGTANAGRPTVQQLVACAPALRQNFTMKHVLLFLIRLYQLCLSPFFGTQCRFYPSCSAYATEAIRVYGALHGSWLAVRRLLRLPSMASRGSGSRAAETGRRQAVSGS